METSNSNDRHASDRRWEPCDLRRPTKLSREQLRSLDLFHDTFARKLSSGLGRLARSSASVEIIRTTQLTWDEYVRTLPAVTTLITSSAAPLPGDILIEMDTSLSLALAGRLIGGSGRMEPPRRPGELELPAVRRIAAVATEALGDALTQFIDVQTNIEAIDMSPQLIGLAAPSQMVLALVYSLAIPGCGVIGDLSVVLSLSTLTPMLEKIMSHAAERAGSELDPMVMRTVAETVPLVLEATLAKMVMPAGSIAALTPGDVVVLDHRIGQLANVSIGDVTVMRGHLGRRGSRLAIAVADHPFDRVPAMAGAFVGNDANGSLNGPSSGSGLHGYSSVAHDVPTDHTARQHDARNAESSTSPVHSLR
ncbi:MAG TPA: FliM/FliN family flagellar motor switch protein [Ilumatobacteraceae bacterium]